jgi:hypothetical protein
MAAMTLKPGWTTAGLCRTRHRHEDPVHRRRCRLLHQGRARLPGFEGGAGRVIDDNGKKGNANEASSKALIERNACSPAAG